jgi:hypothetical protein
VGGGAAGWLGGGAAGWLGGVAGLAGVVAGVPVGAGVPSAGMSLSVATDSAGASDRSRAVSSAAGSPPQANPTDARHRRMRCADI